MREFRRQFIGFFIAVVIAFFAKTPSAIPAQTPQKLRLASTAWSPFTNNAGKPRLALDLVHTALQQLGVNAETTIVPENGFTTAILNGSYDGSAAAWKDAERERTLIFSRPYLENRLILIGRRGSDVSATRLSDLRNQRIALVGGYSYGDELKESSGPVVVSSLSEEDSLKKVLAGEVAYTLMDELVVESILKNYPEQARTRLSIGTVPLIKRTLHLAVRRDIPNAERIIQQFDSKIVSMIADHTYHRLLQLDWIEADVDGDGVPELVSRDDYAGTQPPNRSYLIVSPTRPSEIKPSPRFYLGGKVYSSWTSVPQSYKAPRPSGTLTDGAEIRIFSFEW